MRNAGKFPVELCEAETAYHVGLERFLEKIGSRNNFK